MTYELSGQQRFAIWIMWAVLPRDDNELWDWAKQHGYSNPGNKTHQQYRKTLSIEIERRLNQ